MATDRPFPALHGAPHSYTSSVGGTGNGQHLQPSPAGVHPHWMQPHPGAHPPGPHPMGKALNVLNEKCIYVNSKLIHSFTFIQVFCILIPWASCHHHLLHLVDRHPPHLHHQHPLYPHGSKLQLPLLSLPHLFLGSRVSMSCRIV